MALVVEANWRREAADLVCHQSRELDAQVVVLGAYRLQADGQTFAGRASRKHGAWEMRYTHEASPEDVLQIRSLLGIDDQRAARNREVIVCAVLHEDSDGQRGRRNPVRMTTSVPVQALVEAGNRWCASIDLAGFFDEIPHGLILKLIRRAIDDEPLVTPDVGTTNRTTGSNFVRAPLGK